MIKLVVFDWNGVLIADAQATVAVDRKVFKAFGHKPLDMKTYRETFTMPVIDFFLASGFTKTQMARDAIKIQEMFHRLYEPRIAKVRTRIGARRLLAFLEKRKVEAIILSNHTMEGITNQLERLGIGRYFSRIIANDKHTTMLRKNKAEKFLRLVRNSPYRRSEILIIGDSPEEIEAARAAGVRCVSITGGYYAARRLKDAKPDFLIDSLTEMIGIIQSL
ncbi:MAG: hypothetical protein RLZZ416_183 [Candidatus Parcubacteria bacterium]|jgi:phosphoglycolate phosphatase